MNRSHWNPPAKHPPEINPWPFKEYAETLKRMADDLVASGHASGNAIEKLLPYGNAVQDDENCETGNDRRDEGI